MNKLKSLNYCSKRNSVDHHVHFLEKELMIMCKLVEHRCQMLIKPVQIFKGKRTISWGCYLIIAYFLYTIMIFCLIFNFYFMLEQIVFGLLPLWSRIESACVFALTIFNFSPLKVFWMVRTFKSLSTDGGSLKRYTH